MATEPPLTAPNIASALQLALRHHEDGRLPEAETIYRHILDAEPANADALHLLGLIALQSGQPAEAVELIETANALSPGNPIFLSNLGEAYQKINRPDKARIPCEEALKLKPDLPAAHNNLGNALRGLGELDAAEICYRAAIDLDRSSSLSKVNLGLLRLLRGDYAAGLELYESRLENIAPHAGGDTAQMLASLSGITRWRGESLRGKRLLVWTEQGLGDSVMMMRYLPLIRGLDPDRLLVCCEPALVRLAQGCKAVDEIISDPHSRDWRELIDFQCPMMSLPLAFGTRVETIPNRMPYLEILDELTRRWSARIESLVRPRIGLVWAGGKLSTADPQRSIPLSSFHPLLELRGITLVSLQKDGDGMHLADAGGKLIDWMNECDDILETGALIAQLDLIISVDTVVAHLAGALAKPVWLLNRSGSEWRWLLGRNDTPWYPTMRIFNQRQKDWHNVMEDVAVAVENKFPTARAPLKTRLRRRVRHLFARSG